MIGIYGGKRRFFLVHTPALARQHVHLPQFHDDLLQLIYLFSQFKILHRLQKPYFREDPFSREGHCASLIRVNVLTLWDAVIIIESWQRHYNTLRPHELLDYKPPAPEVCVPALAVRPSMH
jgi:transposase InsO family protein